MDNLSLKSDVSITLFTYITLDIAILDNPLNKPFKECFWTRKIKQKNKQLLDKQGIRSVLLLLDLTEN